MDREQLARRIRDASIQGLCAEGRWEAVVGALRQLDLATLLRKFGTADDV